MAELNLEELTSLLDDHFTFGPPLDNPGIDKVNGRKVGYVPFPKEIFDYGEGFKISGGKSTTDLRGIKNIQVFEPGHSKPVSLQTRIQNFASNGTSPEVIAADLNALLKGGHLSYFEQGREFATRLQLDENNKLHTNPVNPQAPECKRPRRTARQFFRYITGRFNGAERVEYDKKMAVYEMHKQSLAVSRARVEGSKSAQKPESQADGKGRICTRDSDAGRWIESSITTRRESEQLPLEERRIKAYDNIVNGQQDNIYRAELRPKLETLMQQRAEKQQQLQRAKEETKRVAAQRELLKPIYNGNVPENIKSMEDHIQSKIALQETLPIGAQPDGIEHSSQQYGFDFAIRNALLTSLAYTSPHYNKDTPESKKAIEDMKNLVIGSKAFKEIKTYCNKPDKDIKANDPNEAMHKGLEQKVNSNKIFDYFVDVITKYPIQGLSQESCKGLLNLCIDAHPAFQAAAYAPIPKEYEKIAQNANQQQNVGADIIRPKEIQANQEAKPKPKPMGK